MSDDKAKQRNFLRAILLPALLVFIGVIASFAWWATPPRFSGPKPPAPNGYDTLLSAGKQIKQLAFKGGVSPDKATDEELREYVSLNKDALSIANQGFLQESVVPLETTETVEAHLERLGPHRSLSRLLTCQAELARREGRISDALESCINLLRLSRVVSHGGLLTDQMLAEVIQRTAINVLDEEKLLSQHSSKDAQRTIVELERLDRDSESVKTIADRDRSFMLSRQGFQSRLAYLLNRTAMNTLAAPAIKGVESSEKRSKGRRGLLRAKLALHAYSLDHPGQPPPGDIQALVPRYLTEVPMSPDNERLLTLDDLKPDPETTEESLKREESREIP